MFLRPLFGAFILAITLPLAAAAQTAPAPPPPGAAPPAQPPAAAPAHPHPRFMAAIRSLGLTADQMQQIRGFARERKAANDGADAPTRHANAKKFRSEVDGVLTSDQRAQLRAAIVQQRTAPAPQ